MSKEKGTVSKNIIPGKVLIFLIAISFSMSGFAQEQETEPNPKRLERQAEKLIEDENWEEAKLKYKELLSIEPDNSSYNFYTGLSYFNSGVDKEMSARYFKRVRQVDFPVVAFFLGKAYHYIGEFENAKVQFENFIPRIAVTTPAGKELLKEVNLFISYCDQGLIYEKSINEKLSVDNLGDAINTPKTEYCPVLYEKDHYLVFTATNLGIKDVITIEQQTNANEDIYVSSYDITSESWGPRRLPDSSIVSSKINTKENESSIGFSKDKKKFYYFRINDQYVSSEKGKPTPLNVDIDEVHQESLIAIYLTKDEMTRYMVCEIEVGLGGLDIYQSNVDSAGNWSQWENMTEINSEYDEDSPFLSEDKQTFLFSSNRPQSIGGHDIFKATNINGKWGNITNLGMPINSPGNEIHFYPDNDNLHAGYMVSDRQKGKGNLDIYRFSTCLDIEKTNIQGRLMVAKQPVNGKIFVKDEDGNALHQVTAAEGHYTMPVETKKTYQVEILADNMLPQNFTFSIPPQCDEYDIYQEINLKEKFDSVGFKNEQNAEMKNGFFNIDRYRLDKPREEFFAEIGPESKFYAPPLTDTIRLDTIRLDDPLISQNVDVIKKNIEKIQFEDVYFAFDKSKITEESDLIIDKVSKYMNKYEAILVVLKGHTDSKGAASYNKKLSKRRADAVSLIMQKKGIDKNRIVTEAYGEEKLKLKDTDENGVYLPKPAAINRRVEIRLKFPEEQETDK